MRFPNRFFSGAILLAVLAQGCTTTEVKTAPPPAAPAAPHLDPVLRGATSRLRGRDLAGARNILERGRWYANDRARAALLLSGCQLAEGKGEAAMQTLRTYLAKTTRTDSARKRLALRILRNHAAGGTLEPLSPEEACYFGLYSLTVLKRTDVAKVDLEWAGREAPEPERLLARLALESKK